MNAQEIEIWTREIVDSVLNGKKVEDSRVELKAIWIEPKDAAPRLAAHANASRGSSILWIIGVDESNCALTDADPVQKENWYSSVQKYFDGFAPRLDIDVNIRVQTRTVVALFFDTEHEAPYVVTNTKGSGGYPEYVVPWREGTRLRAARRDEILKILVPKRRLSSLADELEFNIHIARTAKAGPYDRWGISFRDEEFHSAIRSGALSSLPTQIKELVTAAYVKTGSANKRVSGALNLTLNPGDAHNAARAEVITALPMLEAAFKALRRFAVGEPKQI